MHYPNPANRCRSPRLPAAGGLPVPNPNLQRPASCETGLQWELEETNRLSSGVDFPAAKKGLEPCLAIDSSSKSFFDMHDPQFRL